ncbi:MAG: EFR1 family ferrodoxin [Sphaerochaetaceae bacterium]
MMDGKTMDTVIACFSGAGNSWHVAQTLARSLGHARVVMMTDVLNGNETLGDPQQLGLVYPVYIMGPPPTVARFIETVLGTMEFSDLQYLFQVATHASKGGACLAVTERLCQKAGMNVSYSAFISMPNTMVFDSRLPEQEQFDAAIVDADSSVDRIVQGIVCGKIVIPKGVVSSRLYLGLRRIPPRILATFSGRFVVTEDCTKCGLCYRGCPAGNITMTENGPQFGHTCEGCMGCYHRCPEHAIAFTTPPKAGYTWYNERRTGFMPEYRT